MWIRAQLKISRCVSAASLLLVGIPICTLGCRDSVDPSQSGRVSPSSEGGAAGDAVVVDAAQGAGGRAVGAGADPSLNSAAGAGATPLSTAAAGATGGSATTTTDVASGGAGSGGAAGAPSAEVAPSILGDVTVSEPSQAFQGELTVALSTTWPNAEIRYTLDHRPPTEQSTLYDGTPLTLTMTTELRAQLFIDGMPTGLITTALYVARDFDAISDIPLIILDGYGQGEATNKDVFVGSAAMVFEPIDGVATLSALPTVAARAGYHVRGSSSATFPQRSYRLEFRDNLDQDLDYPVLGMPAQSDWALVAPYYDRALVRNPFVYDLARDMGLASPQNRHAEVYINYEDRPLASSDYAGVYYFTETIKNAKNRLDLAQLGAADTALPEISGGYIFKFDWAVSEEPTLPCSGSEIAGSAGGGHCWTDLEVVDPSPINQPQSAWLTDYVQQFHDGLHATPIGDYAALIDVDSFVDYFIINELVRNIDEFTRSAYYHKDRDGPLMAGPVWDYNFSLDCGRATNRDPEGWQYPLAATEPNHERRGASDWYPRLATDPAFMDRVATRWRELRLDLFSQAELERRLGELSALLANAASRDIQRWPVDAVFDEFYAGPDAQTWEGQVQGIVDWLALRAAWIDTQFPQP